MIGKLCPPMVPSAQWSPGGAKKTGLAYDNPWSISGQLKLSRREFSLLASGSPTQVKAIGFDEIGLHARGEDVLGLLRAQGLQMRLARCGPVYTESINNWYSVTSSTTRPIMLRQSLRLDGKQYPGHLRVALRQYLAQTGPSRSRSRGEWLQVAGNALEPG